MSFEALQGRPARQEWSVERIKRDFPQLSGPGAKDLAFLDTASTAQKPEVVLQAERRYYAEACANVHRGVYSLAEEATAQYEAARDRVAAHAGIGDRRGVVFTRGTTEAVNLVAYAWARRELQPGDELLVTRLEHHANALPWMQAAAARGASLRWLDIDEQGRLRLDQLEPPAGRRTRLVAVTGLSNVLGVQVPLPLIVEWARSVGALSFVDAAQLAMHETLGFDALGADFMAFSGHKVMGPTGVGALIARPEHLERMEPFFTGGEMVLDVWDDGARWNEIPYKFEAGTPPIAQAIGLGAALGYLKELGLQRVKEQDERLVRHGLARLGSLDGLRLYGPTETTGRVATFAFNLFDSRGELIHPHDVGTVLAAEGVAVRVGHHCAKPLMRRFGVPAMVRASAYVYNTEQDLDRLVAALGRAQDLFR